MMSEGNCESFFKKKFYSIKKLFEKKHPVKAVRMTYNNALSLQNAIEREISM